MNIISFQGIYSKNSVFLSPLHGSYDAKFAINYVCAVARAQNIIFVNKATCVVATCPWALKLICCLADVCQITGSSNTLNLS